MSASITLMDTGAGGLVFQGEVRRATCAVFGAVSTLHSTPAVRRGSDDSSSTSLQDGGSPKVSPRGRPPRSWKLGYPYSLEFDPAGDVVTIWTRDGGKRLRRMIAEVQERGIATLDGILT